MSDRVEDLSIAEEEQQLLEGVETEPTPEAEPQTEEFLEFLGFPPYGTEFVGQHSIDRKHMKDYHDVDLGAKEVVWKKGRNGRFLVPVSDMSPEAVEVLENDPMFKRVTLS